MLCPWTSGFRSAVSFALNANAGLFRHERRVSSGMRMDGLLEQSGEGRLFYITTPNVLAKKVDGGGPY